MIFLINNLVELFGAICTLVGLAKLARLQARYVAKQFDRAGITVKPWVCSPCLSFWLTLAGTAVILANDVRGVSGALVGGVVALVTAGLNYLYEKNAATITK